MTNDDSCSEQLANTPWPADDFMQAFSTWITIVALLITLMLTVQWNFTSPKSLALHPSSTVTTRVPDPVPVKHRSTRQATDRSQIGSVRASPAMQHAASSQEVRSFLCSLVAVSTSAPLSAFQGLDSG